MKREENKHIDKILTRFNKIILKYFKKLLMNKMKIIMVKLFKLLQETNI